MSAPVNMPSITVARPTTCDVFTVNAEDGFDVTLAAAAVATVYTEPKTEVTAPSVARVIA